MIYSAPFCFHSSFLFSLTHTHTQRELQIWEHTTAQRVSNSAEQDFVYTYLPSGLFALGVKVQRFVIEPGFSPTRRHSGPSVKRDARFQQLVRGPSGDCLSTVGDEWGGRISVKCPPPPRPHSLPGGRANLSCNFFRLAHCVWRSSNLFFRLLFLLGKDGLYGTKQKNKNKNKIKVSSTPAPHLISKCRVVTRFIGNP